MKIILILTLIISTFSASGQNDIKKYVARNTNIIKTIQPDSLVFSDLEGVGRAIGDSRIVMLGEQDHGDAPTFLAKTRLIKYLHEQKGFNVLAFEDDFYTFNQGWDVLNKQKQNINAFLKDNLYSIWSQCKQAENLLYSYIPSSVRNSAPLIITGFDSQLGSSYAEKNLKKFVDSFLKDQQIAFTEINVYGSFFLPFIDSALTSTDINKHLKFGSYIDIIMEQLPKKELTFEMMILKNLKVGSLNAVAFFTKSNEYLEIRDKQMAENLKWLVQQKYPNEKIIVWAANGHIFKNPELIKVSTSKRKPMGDFFTQDTELAKSTYIIGFNSRHGIAGRLTNENKYTIMKSGVNSFENWFPETTKFAFVDFKKFRESYAKSSEYFLMKGIDHSVGFAIWTNIYDGVFYVRDMYPCDKFN